MTNTYFVTAIPWANGFSQMMVQCKIVMTVNGVAGQTGSGFRTYSGISTLKWGFSELDLVLLDVSALKNQRFSFWNARLNNPLDAVK